LIVSDTAEQTTKERAGPKGLIQSPCYYSSQSDAGPSACSVEKAEFPADLCALLNDAQDTRNTRVHANRNDRDIFTHTLHRISTCIRNAAVRASVVWPLRRPHMRQASAHHGVCRAYRRWWKTLH